MTATRRRVRGAVDNRTHNGTSAAHSHRAVRAVVVTGTTARVCRRVTVSTRILAVALAACLTESPRHKASSTTLGLPTNSVAVAAAQAVAMAATVIRSAAVTLTSHSHRVIAI